MVAVPAYGAKPRPSGSNVRRQQDTYPNHDPRLPGALPAPSASHRLYTSIYIAKRTLPAKLLSQPPDNLRDFFLDLSSQFRKVYP